MAYQEELQRLVEAKASMRASIIAKGVDVPETAKIEDYPDYIAQIAGGSGSWDPSNPTLEGLKYAIDSDIDVAIGTEIPDKWNGNDNPLIVAQLLDSSNNSSYGGAEGVILVRKYVEPTAQAFGTSVDYSTSTIRELLNSTYLENCSNSLKTMLSSITIPYNGSTMSGDKWFVMSAKEIGGVSSPNEGKFWAYWQDKTDLSAPSINANAGRVVYDREGTARSAWLRTRYTNSTIYHMKMDGGVNYNNPSANHGVLPACFIAKS